MTFERSHLARATKIVVILSTLASILFQALHAGRDWWGLPWMALAAAAAGFAAGRASSRRTVGVVFAAGYLTPVLLLAVGIGFRYWYLSIWMSGFAGVLAGTARTPTTWHVPVRLRFPLVAWALAIAVTWPLVSLRMLDWNPWLLWTPPATLSDAVHAVLPSVWVAHVASVHLLGLLWMDWISGEFVDTPAEIARFEGAIVHPLLAGAAAGGLLAVYQGFFDLNVVSLGVWSELGRASGAQADANASGALSALWVAVALLLAVQARTWAATAGFALASAVLLAATYASSSRTAALCALVALGAVAHLATERRYRRRVLVAAALAAALGIAGWRGLAPSVRGPISRITEVLPSVSVANLRSAGRQLWERQGFGTAGMLIIADKPITGVGVGAFHSIGPSYFHEATGLGIESDNAQNWFRHLLAELGALGSVGWIWWSVLLAGAVVTRARFEECRLSALAARYTIAGFGMASLLGMPSQNPLVSLTVWTLAAWLLLATARPARATPVQGTAEGWALLLALAFAGATLHAGLTSLRPPELAKRFNYLYEYGVYESMDPPQGQTQTDGHAVVAMASPLPHLQLSVWVEHPDADRDPVEVSIWIDGARVVHSRFQKDVPLTRVFPVPGGNRRFLLETRVNRTFAPAAPAGASRPAVGLNLSWKFVE